MVPHAATTRDQGNKMGPCARSFCVHHPRGISCQYCSSQPSVLRMESVSEAVETVQDEMLLTAQKAQKAYWDAIGALECVLDVELEWGEIALSDYTVRKLKKKFGKQK